MRLGGVCIVLHMCAPFHDYSNSLSFWSKQHNISAFGVDGCSNASFPNGVKRLPYVQRKPPIPRSSVSALEREQMRASCRGLPKFCVYVIKLTGKYSLPSLSKAVESLPDATVLALSRRGKSYGGYSSEFFLAERRFYSACLSLWTDDGNTEKFVSRMRSVALSFNASRVSTLPKLYLTERTERYSDSRVLEFL